MRVLVTLAVVLILALALIGACAIVVILFKEND